MINRETYTANIKAATNAELITEFAKMQQHAGLCEANDFAKSLGIDVEVFYELLKELRGEILRRMDKGNPA